MGKYLDFENEKYEKGYEPFELTDANIKANEGRTIVWVTSRDVDSARGYVSPRFGKIYKKRYSYLTVNDSGETIDVRDVLECGIKI